MNKAEIIKEINELLKVPEVEEFFLKALKEAKEKFRDAIENRGQKDTALKDDEPEPYNQDGFSKDKLYFFELKRVKDEESKAGFRWHPGQLNLKGRKDIEDMIRSEFITRLEGYEVAPGLIQDKIVVSEKTGRAFDINFMKSEDRLVGFIKENKDDNAEAFAIEKNGQMIKVATNYQNVNPEEMYKKIYELMEKNPTVRDDIFFYFYMMDKST